MNGEKSVTKKKQRRKALLILIIISLDQNAKIIARIFISGQMLNESVVYRFTDYIDSRIVSFFR